MKNLTFQKLFYATMLVMTTAFFAGCVDDNDDTEAPRLEISPKTLVFNDNGMPVDGSQDYFEISANRNWTAKVLDDKTWVTLSKMEGDGSDKVQVSIPEGITDEATVQIQISNKVGVLMKENVTIRSGNVVPAVLIYNETFGASAPTSRPDSGWPDLTNYTDFVKSGEGIDDISYGGSSVTLRQSGKLSAGYEGASGESKLFFGTNSPNFIIKQITLKAEQTNLKLGFGASYSKSNNNVYDNEFKPESFHVYLSKDGITWSNAIQYEFKQADEYWGYVTSNFTLKESTTNLYIKFVADIESGFAIDDVALFTGNGGQEIDLGTSGPEEPATEITISELNAMMPAGDADQVLEASYYFEAVVQNDVVGGNYSFNNLILATENATEPGNGITIYDNSSTGSLVEPSTHDLDKGDKVKITLRKSLAKVKNYKGMHELVGTGDWISIEKLEGKATITPVKIAADKLADYQGMAVTIENVTNSEMGVWTTEDALHSHDFNVAGTEFIVFCKKGADAFVNQTFKKVDSPVSISGLAAVNNNTGQLVPRNLDDTQELNAAIPYIVSVSPNTLKFPAEGGSEDIEVTVVNFEGKTLKAEGLSGILEAKVEGTKVTVKAAENKNSEAIPQTLKLSVDEGNILEVPVTVEGKPSENATIITLDLTTAENYPSNFPVGNAEKKTEAATYKFGEYDYTISPSASGAYYQIANAGKVYIFFGKKGAYIELPAIPDKKLTKVTITSHSGAAKGTQVGIADTSNTIVKGGEGKVKDTNNHTFTYDLSETANNTKYRIYIVTDANSQIGGWTLVYE